MERIKTVGYYPTPPTNPSQFVESIKDNGHVVCFTEESFIEALGRQWDECDNEDNTLDNQYYVK